MNRKGLSPLSSTIILLVVSILIGVIVMTWGQSYVQQAAGSANSVSVPQNPTVLQDLNDRLSRGEISQEQYNQIKVVLLKQSN